MNCAPHLKKKRISCFSLNELRLLAIAFNKWSSNNNNKLCSVDKCIKPKLIPESIIQTTSKKKLWIELNNRFQIICNSEICWTNLDFVNLIQDNTLRKKFKQFTFKPPPPSHENSWLSNHDIEAVCKQYELSYPKFKFLGALPANFYKIINFNSDMIHHYDSIGIVFNLDTYDQGGSHWVSFFIDNKQRTCEYFDSTGMSPNKYIKSFIIYLMSNCCKNYTYHQNYTKHQYENSECGIYSIFFILSRLEGQTFSNLTTQPILDNKMRNFRKIYFQN